MGGAGLSVLCGVEGSGGGVGEDGAAEGEVVVDGEADADAACRYAAVTASYADAAMRPLR